MKTCPICGHDYDYLDPKVEYHVSYFPVEIIANACRGCNYAEFLIRHPEIPTGYYMKKKIVKVREWTLKNRPFLGL